MNTIVFDIDDTISTNIRRTGYNNCKPIKSVIQKINELHDEQGYKIILHTSRGMLSCNGDIQKATEKNKYILEQWLKNNDVHYDDIVFGKPLADLYVDDKAMNPQEFLNGKFEKISGGGSGCNIYRMGNIIKKEFENNDAVTRFKDFMEDNNIVKKPNVISYLENAVYMEYIDGYPVVEVLNERLLSDIIVKILQESEQRKEFTEFNIDNHINILRKNRCHFDGYVADEHNRYLSACEKHLISKQSFYKEHASICHGDMILSNMIISKQDRKIYYIDPQYFRKESSYLLDFAKLRMSLCDYEKTFNLSVCKQSNKKYVYILDNVLKQKGIFNEVLWLQLMYTIRLYRYKESKLTVIHLERELVKENEDVFEGM